MSNDDEKDDKTFGVGVIDFRTGNLPDNMPSFVKEALKHMIRNKLGIEAVDGKGFVRLVNPEKVVILSDMMVQIWQALPCYNNPADMLGACLLRAKLMRMDGEKQDAPAELFEQAEKVAEEIFQKLSKNPDPEDTSVH